MSVIRPTTVVSSELNEGVRVVLGPPFYEVHDQFLCLTDIEGEVVVQAPHYQVSDLPIGCLIVVRD